MKRENDKKKENEIKKEFLRSYRLHANRMERILEEIEELREMQMLPMQNMDGMPHAGAAGGLENYAALFDEKDKELEKEKEQKIQAYSKIVYSISKLEEKKENDVLFYRYIKGWDWEEISEKMNYSKRWVLDIHGKALEHLEI